jgi:hypothetical protein
LPSQRYERLESILEGAEGERVRRFDQSMDTDEPVQISIILTSLGSHLGYVGGLLTRTDRELRRVVNILDPAFSHTYDTYYLGTPSNRPKPISPKDGGLRIEDATAGSLHLLVQAYGHVLSLLTSRPLAALTTLITLGQGAGSIHLWPRRRNDPLERMSARQLLNVIRELGGDPAQLMRGQPASFEMNVEPIIDEDLHAYPEDSYIDFRPALYVADESNRSGEIIVRGRRMTYIREHQDGTKEIIYIEG